jgi:hypothetical protein
MARFYFGQVVNASISDGTGKTKVRPAVIISEDDDYEIEGEIQVVAITKDHQTPCPDYHIQVHNSTRRDPLTGLYYPCWAKCNWAPWLEIRRIKSTCGHMPDDLLTKIVDTYDRLLADEDFTDWE